MSCCCLKFENSLSDLALSKTKGLSYGYGQIIKFEGDPSEEEKNLFISIVESQKSQHVVLLRVFAALVPVAGPFCCVPLAVLCCLKQHNNQISEDMRRKAGNRKYGCKTYFGSTSNVIVELNPAIPINSQGPQGMMNSQFSGYPLQNQQGMMYPQQQIFQQGQQGMVHANPYDKRHQTRGRHSSYS